MKQDSKNLQILISYINSLKSPYEVALAAKWNYVTPKLYNLVKPLLQIEMFDLQEIISSQMYKIHALKNVEVNMSQKKMKITKTSY